MGRPAKIPQSGQNFVYSSLANDQIYRNYTISGEGIPPSAIPGEVYIKGGAGVAVDLGMGRAGETTSGEVTAVTDEQLAYLEQNTSFKEHEKNGYIVVIKGVKKDPEVVAADMSRNDPSAPLTPQDMMQEGATVSVDDRTKMTTIEMQPIEAS